MRKLTHKEFEERVFKAHGKNIIILGKYVNKKTKVLVSHKCGYIWEANPETLQKGHGCPKCAGNVFKNTETFKEEVFGLVGNEYSVIGEYTGTHCKIKFRHNLCGNEFYMVAKSFLSGQRCPNERYEKSSLKNQTKKLDVDQKIKELFGSEYVVLNDYCGISRKCSILHKTCGETFLGTPRKLITEGVGCPKCSGSKGEKIISELLNEFNANYIREFRIKQCKNIRPLPFDFAIFDQDKKLKCLIEYDGIQHFVQKFNKKNYESTLRNDSIKTNFCKDNGIKLVRIKYLRTSDFSKFKEYIKSELFKNDIIQNMPISYQDGEA